MGICAECSKKMSELETEIKRLNAENGALKDIIEKAEIEWNLLWEYADAQWKLNVNESDRFYALYEKEGNKQDWKKYYAYLCTYGAYRDILTKMDEYGGSDNESLGLFESEINRGSPMGGEVRNCGTDLSRLEGEYGLLKKKWGVLKLYVDISAKLDLRKETNCSQISSVISELESGDDMCALDILVLQLDELKKLL